MNDSERIEGLNSEPTDAARTPAPAGSGEPPTTPSARSRHRRKVSSAKLTEESHGAYWSIEASALTARLGTSATGLSSVEAARRLALYGPNAIATSRARSRLHVFAKQFASPLLLLLVFAALTSIATGEWLDAGVVLMVVGVSVGIGYTREYGAQSAAAALQLRIRTHARVYRDGALQHVPVEELVPGDIILLAAGSLVPADGVLLEATNLYANQAVLTGESFPVLKRTGRSAPSAALSERENAVFMGTNVRSGTATCLIVHTAKATHFGELAQRLVLRSPETAFDRGTRHFGYLLTTAMLCLVISVFTVHVAQGRPAIETLLFAVALAVGLSPELLPVILNVNLARGAESLAQHGVLVRRLNALENLGSMNILCTDKTGTLTEGVVVSEGAYDPLGAPSSRVLTLGVLNSVFSTGLENPLDEALLRVRAACELEGVEKLSEIPFDFIRKRVSVVARDAEGIRLVTKGAFQPVLASCTQLAGGTPIDAAERARLLRRFETWSAEGTRVVAVATRMLDTPEGHSPADEVALTFEGFLTFSDRPKQGVAAAIAKLAAKSVRVKLVSGDARAVAEHVAREVGLSTENVITGKELEALHDEALWHRAERTDIFAEVDPNQKERIILALKKLGHVVGFMGDGVNDAPAMHAADVSLSVDQAVDVAKEAADLVLLERSLDVIHDGIEIGRKTLANTMKYILTTTSANLGNMISMAAASLFLPFLPLLASQILLNNFLSDIPAVGIAGDTVDPELVERPERWDMRFIARFMTQFGILSSAFDLMTFAILGLLLHAPIGEFRTAWFVESLLTELAIALVVRTRRACFRSRPGRTLLRSTIALVLLTLALPYLPFAAYLHLTPLPFPLLGTIVGITVLYVLAAELLKSWFYRTRGLGPTIPQH